MLSSCPKSLAASTMRSADFVDRASVRSKPINSPRESRAPTTPSVSRVRRSLPCSSNVGFGVLGCRGQAQRESIFGRHFTSCKIGRKVACVRDGEGSVGIDSQRKASGKSSLAAAQHAFIHCCKHLARAFSVVGKRSHGPHQKRNRHGGRHALSAHVANHRQQPAAFCRQNLEEVAADFPRRYVAAFDGEAGNRRDLVWNEDLLHVRAACSSPARCSSWRRVRVKRPTRIASTADKKMTSTNGRRVRVINLLALDEPCVKPTRATCSFVNFETLFLLRSGMIASGRSRGSRTTFAIGVFFQLVDVQVALLARLRTGVVG
jgi:hypothetical protein